MRALLAIMVLLAACGSTSSSPDAGASPGDANAARPDANPNFSELDSTIESLMSRWDIPGAAVAVTHEGRLVLANGYGVSAPATPTAPDALFRIASLSKAVTAIAILRLVELGMLGLDDPAFAKLPNLPSPTGSDADPRLANITVRHLLHHTGGWDRDISGDPMFRSTTTANALGQTPPATADMVVRYMRGQMLDFDPGSRYAYSNFGYAVLGRIIEAVTGSDYESWVKTHVLSPMGITRMRIGATKLEDRAPGEVRYYPYPGESNASSSVFPEVQGPVPWAYGGWHLEAMDAHGGWIASAVDLSRMLLSVDGRETFTEFLSPASVASMTARPTSPDWSGSSYWYAMGLLVRPSGTDFNWWHSGSLSGTATIFVRSHHGFTWVALFNSRPQDSAFFGDMDSTMWDAVNTVSDWPEHDLFGSF